MGLFLVGCYTGYIMLQLFNKTFWRFALGFVGILILGLGVFLIIGYAEYNSRSHDETAQVNKEQSR
ncbi:MAG: hypothetical protein G01um101448_824 [Parcubacteria group bacterium Gr01-1014_48]|nr:MAG: hypothetical protein Greene041614_315 [Parcubacteria group bacterium Greene0416_14]TSC73295.1 MAG: hypothetical protein G01um101448_824 [Parcubacteria group bacterium Gr01-1014_48]TSC99714.1 MAG: hypothetical protein Greene101415_1116 [Parcubacteria group bacterium Greene1014_15]TSD07779.1 MAG: hypothetical protein Greene07144_736 [Parcubacteria group bacterium Greene0714_4]